MKLSANGMKGGLGFEGDNGFGPLSKVGETTSVFTKSGNARSALQALQVLSGVIIPKWGRG